MAVPKNKIAVQIVVMIAGGAVILVRLLMDMQLAQVFLPTALAIYVIVVPLFMTSIWRREDRKDIP